jgi:hypothetical protein
MKANASKILAVSAIILALSGYMVSTTAAEWPVGSSSWWQQMDREGRGGNAGN